MALYLLLVCLNHGSQLQCSPTGSDHDLVYFFDKAKCIASRDALNRDPPYKGAGEYICIEQTKL